MRTTRPARIFVDDKRSSSNLPATQVTADVAVEGDEVVMGPRNDAE